MNPKTSHKYNASLANQRSVVVKNLEEFNPGGVKQSVLRKKSELGGELSLLLSRV